jgi:hypothetical protein
MHANRVAHLFLIDQAMLRRWLGAWSMNLTVNRQTVVGRSNGLEKIFNDSHWSRTGKDVDVFDQLTPIYAVIILDSNNSHFVTTGEVMLMFGISERMYNFPGLISIQSSPASCQDRTIIPNPPPIHYKQASNTSTLGQNAVPQTRPGALRHRRSRRPDSVADRHRSGFAHLYRRRARYHRRPARPSCADPPGLLLDQIDQKEFPWMWESVRPLIW